MNVKLTVSRIFLYLLVIIAFNARYVNAAEESYAENKLEFAGR